MKNFEDTFIGIVYDADKLTRNLEVFIPKLMPAIPEGRVSIKTATNFGNPSIDIKYNKNITIASTITAKAQDMDEPLPKKGSRVNLFFLENNPKFCYWTKWNSNGDYEVVDDEKYKKLFKIRVGDRELDISEEDFISIEFPSGVKIIKEENGKEKRLRITEDNELSKRVDSLEEILGNSSYVEIKYDDSGTEKEKLIEASGLLKKIQELEERISKLEKN